MNGLMIWIIITIIAEFLLMIFFNILGLYIASRFNTVVGILFGATISGVLAAHLSIRINKLVTPSLI